MQNRKIKKGSIVKVIDTDTMHEVVDIIEELSDNRLLLLRKPHFKERNQGWAGEWGMDPIYESEIKLLR